MLFLGAGGEGTGTGAWWSCVAAAAVVVVAAALGEGGGQKTDFLHERALLQSPRIVKHANGKGISVGDRCKR